VPLDTTRRQLALVDNAAYRAAFKPHAIIITERTRLEPMSVAAFAGPERLLRLDFDGNRTPVTFVRQALDDLRQWMLR